MTNSIDSNETRRVQSAATVVSDGRAITQVRCRLCSETVTIENDFRPMSILCPHCGLKFDYDPMRRPLPARGVRLRYADVAAAQPRPGRQKSAQDEPQPHRAAPLPVPAETFWSKTSWMGLAFVIGVLVCRIFWSSLVRM